MCLTILNIKTRKEAGELAKNPKVAKKDIIVYKVLRRDNTSPYKDFLYQKGREYYRYGKIFKIKITKDYWGELWRIKIEDGLHSYTSFKVAGGSKWGNQKVVKMIIPKGALYFENTDKTKIVSSKLWWP